MQIEQMVEGIGFYIRSRTGEGIPSFDDLRGMIAETAYLEWLNAGCPPGDGQVFWLEAEIELFGPMERGGYNVLFCDLDHRYNQSGLRYWDSYIVTPKGFIRV